MSNLNRTDSTDGRVERAKDAALGSHDGAPSHFDEAGEGVGGVSGAITGAAIGSAVGPLGTILGGIAGTVGGWWAGRAVTEAASTLTSTDDEYYQSHYESSPNRLADRAYDDVRPAYVLGHIAAQNPDYAFQKWDSVSGDLQRGWSVDSSRKYGDWNSASQYANEAFTRSRSELDRKSGRTDGDTANAFDRVVPAEERR